MGKHFKILGLSLLALVGVMAVSASAAQAKWLLLRNGTSVSSLNITGSSSEDGTLVVPGNGIEIECTSSEGSASVSLSEENKKLSGTATVTFLGCEETEFGEVCETHSVGQPDGTIVATGTGKGGDDGNPNEVWLLNLSASEEFTNVQFTGEECPLTEIEGETKGRVKITALTALEDAKLHVIHIKTSELKFGAENAEVKNETGGDLILGSIEEETGATFAAHLIGL